MTTNTTDKTLIEQAFMKRVSDSLVDKIIEATPDRPQLTFRSLSIFYVFIDTIQSNTSRKKRAEDTTSTHKTEVYSEVEYEYSCEFGPQCTKFSKNLDEDPPEEDIRENLLQLETGKNQSDEITVGSKLDLTTDANAKKQIIGDKAEEELKNEYDEINAKNDCDKPENEGICEELRKEAYEDQKEILQAAGIKTTQVNVIDLTWNMFVDTIVRLRVLKTQFSPETNPFLSLYSFSRTTWEWSQFCSNC